MRITLNRTDRFWLLGGLLIAVAVFAIGYLMFISPQYSNADSLRSQADDAVTNVAVKQKHLDELAQQNAHLDTFKAELAKDQAALPATSDIPAFLRSLQAIGTSTGVSVTSVAVANPVAYVATATTPATTGSGKTASGISGGVLQIPITLSVGGPAANLMAFMNALQSQQPRAVLVTAADRTSGTSTSGGSTLSLTIVAFMAPGSS